MNPLDRLDNLIAEWLHRYRAGERLTVQQLAPNEPELHETLARRIERRLKVLIELDTRQQDSQADIDLPPPQLPGYQLIEQAGKSAIGVIFQAVQIGTGQTVAIKFLLAGRNAPKEVIKRFRLEAKMQERIRHPNVVRVLDRSKADGVPFIVLEWMAGRDMWVLYHNKRPPLADALRWMISICRGVSSIHDYGLLHRDIKPNNILFDAYGTPKVGDFGLVRQWFKSAGLTMPGSPIGTPAFMPPEQAVGRLSLMCPATDVYGIGTVLFFLLTGRPPYFPDHVEDLMNEIMIAPVPRLRDLAPAAPMQLEVICRRCLMKDPAQRYQTVSALMSDLRRAYAVLVPQS